MNALQQMRCGDIGHVKRGILPQQHDVSFGKINQFCLAHCHVIARLVAHLD